MYRDKLYFFILVIRYNINCNTIPVTITVKMKGISLTKHIQDSHAANFMKESKYLNRYNRFINWKPQNRGDIDSLYIDTQVSHMSQ